RPPPLPQSPPGGRERALRRAADRHDLRERSAGRGRGERPRRVRPRRTPGRRRDRIVACTRRRARILPPLRRAVTESALPFLRRHHHTFRQDTLERISAAWLARFPGEQPARSTSSRLTHWSTPTSARR